MIQDAMVGGASLVWLFMNRVDDDDKQQLNGAVA